MDDGEAKALCFSAMKSYALQQAIRRQRVRVQMLQIAVKMTKRIRSEFNMFKMNALKRPEVPK